MLHGNNFQCLHSNPQKRTGNYSKGNHDLILISSSEAACGDSSAHILVLQSVFFFSTVSYDTVNAKPWLMAEFSGHYNNYFIRHFSPNTITSLLSSVTRQVSFSFGVVSILGDKKD